MCVCVFARACHIAEKGKNADVEKIYVLLFVSFNYLKCTVGEERDRESTMAEMHTHTRTHTHINTHTHRGKSDLFFHETSLLFRILLVWSKSSLVFIISGCQRKFSW